MALTLALLHTGHLLIPVFAELGREFLPGVNIFHMLDESLIKNTIAAGRLEPVTIRRVASLVGLAREAGADAVLVTCSSIGPAVELARQLFDFPVLRVDEAMAAEACRLGKRIGVLATLDSTLEPTVNLLQRTAEKLRRDSEIVSGLCEGAYDAVVAGDTATHDRLLAAKLAEVADRVDVVVLAQASMAGALKRMPAMELKVPILASPELAIRQTRDILSALDKGNQRSAGALAEPESGCREAVAIGRK
jgi:Asp/Glu/hydantoin racemase